MKDIILTIICVLTLFMCGCKSFMFSHNGNQFLNGDFVKSEKSTSDNYIEYLKEKLKSIVGKDDSKTVIDGDGEYKELYKDASIEAQAALTSELLSKCDNETLIQEDSQTIMETLVYYAGRLASLKAKGKTESKRVILNKATIKGGKVTYLRYRLCNAQTGEVEDDDEICPNCYGLED